MIDPFLEGRDPVPKPYLSVLIPEEARVGEARSQHPFIAGDDRLPAVCRDIIGYEEKSRSRRTVGQQQTNAGSDVDAKPEPIRNRGSRIGRNDPCPCGSGKKYKNCCLRKGGGSMIA